MSRRSHQKSKNGCAECKKRHIRCDETLPVCVNCRTAGRQCPFARQAERPSQWTYPSPASVDNPVERTSPLSDLPGSTTALSAVNVEHFELFCHFCTVTFRSFSTEHDQAHNYTDFLHECVIYAPYLLHQTLAISALHLSFLRPDRQSYYRACASSLQTQALSLFNNMDPAVEDLNTLSSFMFCAMTGSHVLCDTLRYHDGNLDLFLNQFTHFFRVHRGVKIVADASWASFRQSRLGPYLEQAERLANNVQTGTECDVLQQMLRQADIGETSLEAYGSAVKHLQWAYDVDRNARTLPESRQMLLAWTLLAPTEYTDLLEQRRPEALVILAHYAVLLHRHRDLWLVGNGGESLIRSIVSTLGPWWDQWLELPSTEISRTAASVS